MTKRTGQIEKRGNRYRARLFVGTKADGSRRNVSKTFDTRREAETWLMEQSVELGRRPDLSAGITLCAVWDLFVADKGKHLVKKTMQAYTSLMNVHWLPTMGDADVSTITCAQVQYRLDSMTHENALHAKRCLSSVLTYAVGRGLLAENPMHGHKFDIPAKEVCAADFDDDPFSAVEERREVWDVITALRCMELIEGLPLEPAWLACIGAGLRVEEALALRKIDVRRVTVGDHEVTQLAVHAARTPEDGLKVTKTRQSVRVVPMLEPFGERYWNLREAVDDPKGLVCTASARTQNRAWHNYFTPPKLHSRMSMERVTRGRLQELPYIPLAKMRNSHVTLLQEAGVSDSINAFDHGNSEAVVRRNYQRPDVTEALMSKVKGLRLVV